ncbi:MAG: O-antigen ligase family protein [Candidatus Ryanbacteria bacterium]|nr:O-antigen ligase family protein [Candidatus Ryanbacteria bacterium]
MPLVSWNGFFFGVTFTKTLVFLFGTQVAFILWLGSVTPRRPAFIVSAVAFFVAIVGLATIVGVESSQSFWSNYERMFGFVTYIHGLVYLLMLADVLRDDRNRKLFLSSIVAVGAIVASIAIIQFLIDTSGSRPTSSLYNAAFLGSYLLLLIFPTLYLGLSAKEKKTRTLWFYAAGTMIIGLMVSGARAAMIGLAAGSITFASSFLWSHERKTRRLAVAFFLLVVVSGGFFFLLRAQLADAPFVFVRRLARASIADPSVSSRFLSWQVAWEGWRDRPIFGWGPENFNILFSEHYDPRLVDFEPWFDRAHNIIFDIGSTTGFAGLLAYAGIFIAIGITLWRLRADKLFVIVFIATFAAYLVEHLFVFDSIPSFVLVLSMLAYIASHSQSLGKDQARIHILRIVLTGVVVCIVSYFVVWSPAQENRIGRKGFDILATGHDVEAINLYDRALSYATYGDIDVRRSVAEYIFECAKAWEVCGSKRPADAQARILDYAISAIEQNIVARSHDVKWLMYQGQLYRMRSMVTTPPDHAFAALAEKRFSEAQKMSPGRAQNYLEIALARKLQGNITGMWSILEDGERAAPDYLVVQYNIHSHAVDLADKGREQEALHKILDSQKTPQYDLLGNAYIRNKRYGDAIGTQLQWIDVRSSSLSNKDLAPLYQQLAALYRVVGDNQKARDAALKVRELDARLASEVEAFLNTLR